MPECNYCKRGYHYCTSCDYDEPMSNGYCCTECFEKSDKYVEYFANAKKFLEDLTWKQRKMFYVFMADYSTFETEIKERYGI